MAQPSNVRRYRSGVVPQFAQSEPEPTFIKPAATKGASAVVDKRLQRLTLTETGDQNERLSRHKRIIHEAAIITPQEKQEELPSGERVIINQPEIAAEEDAIAERRRRIQKALEQQRREEEEEAKRKDEEMQMESDDDEEGEGEGEEDDSSEEESDESSEDDWGAPKRPMIIPKFVPKDKRTTIVDADQIEKDEEKKQRERERELEERKKRTLEYLKEDKEREAEAAAMKPADEEDVDTDDEEKGEQTKEFDEWQLRELTRIKRDREAREKIKNEKLEIEARRAMTDDEVIEERLRLDGPVKEKKKVKFLQKYYHKGAFYSEELKAVEGKGEHDWLAPTGEDKFVDKEDLPAVLQVKNFGLMSRSKYTHLKDQDTTRLDDPLTKRVVPDRILKSLGGAPRPIKKQRTG